MHHSTAINPSHDDGPGWEQQQQSEEHHRWASERANGKLSQAIKAAVGDGANLLREPAEKRVKEEVMKRNEKI